MPGAWRMRQVWSGWRWPSRGAQYPILLLLHPPSSSSSSSCHGARLHWTGNPWSVLPPPDNVQSVAGLLRPPAVDTRNVPNFIVHRVIHIKYRTTPPVTRGHGLRVSEPVVNQHTIFTVSSIQTPCIAWQKQFMLLIRKQEHGTYHHIKLIFLWFSRKNIRATIAY